MPSSAAAQVTKRTPSSTTDRPAHRRVEDEEVRPYVIVSDLGKGSFATVYRGYHEVSFGGRHTGWNQTLTHNVSQETHVPVAIKTVNRNGLSQKLFENLRGEIDILKTLSHRHITRLLDLVVCDHLCFVGVVR
jgi:serine/threonine-protein kinase ULK2